MSESETMERKNPRGRRTARSDDRGADRALQLRRENRALREDNVSRKRATALFAREIR